MAGPLLEVSLGRLRKNAEAILTEVAAEVMAELKEVEHTAGRGAWPPVLPRRDGHIRRPLRGITRHMQLAVSGTKLVLRGKESGKRGGQVFLWAHHQLKGSRGPLTITPQRARRLYVPLSVAAEKLTAREAYERSSRFGGSLKEGTIIKGELYYYDPKTVGEPKKDRLVPGVPDFLWLPRVRLPRRALFDRSRLQRLIRSSLIRAFKKHRPDLTKTKVKFTVTLF